MKKTTKTVPPHKRTITLTKQSAEFYKLPTKLFVQFPEINFVFHVDSMPYNSDGKRKYLIGLSIDSSICSILNVENKRIIFKNGICLGKQYFAPLTDKKINQIIERFFNSKFSTINIS